MKSDQPALDLLILALLGALVGICWLCFFHKPAYDAGAYAIIGALIAAFSGACGAKWGLSQSGRNIPPDSTVTRQTTETVVATEPKP